MLGGLGYEGQHSVLHTTHLACRVACSSCNFAASREVSRRSVRPSTPSACSLLRSKGGDCNAAEAEAASGAERMVWQRQGRWGQAWESMG